jgi:serine/threonine protein phosphatase 1
VIAAGTKDILNARTGNPTRPIFHCQMRLILRLLVRRYLRFHGQDMIWSTTPAASVPPGQRIYAIGDVHGRLDLLDQMLRMIRLDDGERPPVEQRTLIFLGDYVDRGPDSRGVIDRLLSPAPDGFERICLTGNHEAMLLQAIAEPATMYFWMTNGGRATLTSYDVETEERGLHDLAKAFAEALPGQHRDFLRGLKMSAAFGDYFFVHAGVQPGVPLDEQSVEACVFIREPFLSHRGSFGKIVVHGHTPVREPEIRTNRIGIDTGACFTGRLTALRLEGESRGFLAT